MSKYYYHATSDLMTFKDILKDKQIKCARLLGKTFKHDLSSLGFNGLDYISVCNKLDYYDDIYGESSFEQFIYDHFCFIISGEIKCRKLIDAASISISRSLDVTFGVGYNGNEYISLCRLNDDSYQAESAYQVFVRNRYCFIISDEIPAIKSLDINSKEIREQYSKELLTFIKNRDISEIRFSDMKDEWQVKKHIPLQYIVGIGIPKRRLEFYPEYFYSLQRAIALAEIYHFDVVDTSDYKFIEKYETNPSTDYEKEKIKTIVYQR